LWNTEQGSASGWIRYFHNFYTKIKAENQSLNFYPFIKLCEFVIFKNNHTVFIKKGEEATKLEMAKHFIRSDVTLSATVDLTSIIELCIYDAKVKVKFHRAGYI